MQASTKMKLKAKLQEIYNFTVIALVVAAIIYYLPVMTRDPMFEDGLYSMGSLIIAALIGLAAHKSE